VAECSVLLGVFVPETVVDELCDGVVEWLEIDGVATGPPTPRLE
jgi:hypothetical protein